jgi:hypothetical protein
MFLFFFLFIRQNLDFSMGYDESKDKIIVLPS